MRLSLIQTAIQNIEEDFCWVEINEIKFCNGDIELSVTVKDGDSVVGVYVVNFQSVLDFTIDELGGGWNYMDSNHCRIKALSENAADLYLGNRNEGIEFAIMDVVREHLLVWNDWVSMSETLNTSMISRSANLSSGGKIASGPKFIIDRYAEILNNHNIDCSILSLVRNFKGDESIIDNVKGVHFGNSFVISREITERLV